MPRENPSTGIPKSRRETTHRAKLGLPSLDQAKEALREHVVHLLSDADFPIRNEEELRTALRDQRNAEQLVELVCSRDYLFTNAEQIAEAMAQRAAALWDLSSRPEHREDRELQRRRALLLRMAFLRKRFRGDPGKEASASKAPVH
jgi:hypothetical protein